MVTSLNPVRLDLAQAALRVILAAVFIGNGGQKLFGWFGGSGLQGQAKAFESYCQMGVCLRPGMPFAVALGGLEFFGGILVLLGLFTPVIALLYIVEMTGAMFFRSSKLGFFGGPAGMETNLLLLFVAFTILLLGAGRFGVMRMIRPTTGGQRP